MVEIAPSILSADFTKLGEQIRAVETGGAGVLHFDVMDGRFVPNITIGLPVLESIRKFTRLPIDVHLMIVEPANYALKFIAAGADRVSVHVEADPHLHRTLTAIRAAGAQAGVCLNPATPLGAIEEALSLVDFVNMMSVNPGFGGQKFIKPTLAKMRRLKMMIQERDLPVRIEVDGGVDTGNIAEIVAAGAEIIVAGSAVFGAENPATAVSQLIDAATVWT